MHGSILPLTSLFLDVDECSSSDQPCGEGHVCINGPGNYRCECKSGYSFDVISRTCIGKLHLLTMAF